MSERLVTTIGDLGITPRARIMARSRSLALADELDVIMGIGEEDPSPDGGFIVPVLVPPSGAALAIPEPDVPATPSTPSGSPKAAPYVRAAWRPDGSYVLQPGNTLWGLAVSYLSSGPRWPEIWNVQPSGYRSQRTPDKIFAGDVIAMPTEAQAKARALGLYGVGSSVLGRGFTKTQVALAAAGVGVVGLLFAKG